jgi:hypothetical protein
MKIWESFQFRIWIKSVQGIMEYMENHIYELIKTEMYLDQ